MTDRPVIRLLNPRNVPRKAGPKRSLPRPKGPNRKGQGKRFQATFDRMASALEGGDPVVELRQDPAGIAPERALVFVTAGEVQDFAKVAREAGLEVFAALDLEELEDFPEGFVPASGSTSLTPALYATMPTIESFEKLLTLWRAYLRGEDAPRGAAPWWKLFELLIELRPWGPEDRFPESVRVAIADRLPFDDDEEVFVELEIWPTTNEDRRSRWRLETERHIEEHGGRIVDRSSISTVGFVYEALLAGLSVGSLRELLADPFAIDGLASLDGIQFILPQTIAQAPPTEGVEVGEAAPAGEFSPDAPVRGALFDGTPVAGHRALDGGINVEDIHDLVRLSQVNDRYHATSMASLILRGDLDADGLPLTDARIVSVPLLVDANGSATSPIDKLLVDLLHTGLSRLFLGDEALAPQAFVVNLSIGVRDMRFAGRVSALARLIDWWASQEGILFVISAGNIPEDLVLSGMSTVDFEDSDPQERKNAVRAALRESAYERCLMAPAESLNGITVGALSEDLADDTNPPDIAGIVRIENEGEVIPPITSALGLGPFRAIKPDLMASGGIHEVRAHPAVDDTRLSVIRNSQRTGLFVAAPHADGGSPTLRSRGTSCSAALTTRAVLQSAEALVAEDGPFQGEELPRQDFALLTRALAVNSARWSDEAHALYGEELDRLGNGRHVRAKEEVIRHFGHGVLSPLRMLESPETGVTLVGLSDIRKDQAKIFDLPLPESLSGDRVPRSMRVTLAWFSPVDISRVRYRLAALEAMAESTNEDGEASKDKEWGLKLKSDGPDENMLKRGTVWSRRLVHARLTAPNYDPGESVPIRVQCRDSSGGGLDPDFDIRFAIAVTLEIETPVEYDVYNEVRAEIALRLRGRR